MPCEQIIDKVADDRIRFVAQFRDDATDKCAAARVPFQIDGAVRILCAVDLGPAVRSRRLFGPDFNKAKFLLQLRIAHDLVAQRAASCRDDLNHRLHRLFCESSRSGVSSIINHQAKHDVNIDKAFLRVSKRARQRADNLETELLPQVHGRFVRRDDKVELHGAKTEPACFD